MKTFIFISVALVSAVVLTACGITTQQAQAPPASPIALASPTKPIPTNTTIPPTNTAAATNTALPPTTAPTDTIPAPTATQNPTATATQPVLSAETQAVLASLPNKGVAPAVRNEVWLNSDPLEWESLAGKVVIVDFWTYG